MSRPFRNKFEWPGAQWVAEVDDAIKSFATADQGLAPNERRVVLAEKERGEEWAKQYLEQNPFVTRDIYEALSAPDAANNFPSGVIETVQRYSPGSPQDTVRRIVRDAYNHDAAIASSGTQTPFLLAPREARFHQLLEAVRQASDVTFPEKEDTSNLQPQEFAELTSEVLDVLRHLEAERKTETVSHFVRSGGHELLARWMRYTCSSLSRTDSKSLRGEVIARLRQEFDGGKFEDDLSDIFLNRKEVIGLLGGVSGLVESVVSEVTVYGAIGLASGAYAIGHGLAQKLGYEATEYDGPQWAFMYAFGRRATRRRQASLRRTLDLLAPSE